MPVSRMRMRPWLEKMIESNSIPGLKWADTHKTTFTIPWKHAARHGWELDKDACLFKQWAIHTGKYVQGQTSDPKTWKANFRCAMNSLPDIKEVKDKSVNKGHQAMRVFRMLPVTQKSRDKRSKGKETKSRKKSSALKKEEDLEDYSDTQTPMDQSEDASSTQENTIDSTVNTEQPDFSFLTPSEVPDWSLAVEIEAESIHHSFCNRFQVSPEHESCDDADAVIQIRKQLEADSHWMSSSLDSSGFLNNEACTSPGSQWSDTSSDIEADYIPRYTNLGTDYTNGLDDFWSGHGISHLLWGLQDRTVL